MASSASVSAHDHFIIFGFAEGAHLQINRWPLCFQWRWETSAGALESLKHEAEMAFPEKRRRQPDQWSGVAVVHVQAAALLWLKTTAVVFVRLSNTPCHLSVGE